MASPAMMMGGEALGGNKGPKPKKGVHMSIRKTKNGGYHVENAETEDGMPNGKKSDFAFEDIQGLHDHIDKHFGKKSAKPKKEKESKKEDKKEKKEKKAEKKEEKAEKETPKQEAVEGPEGEEAEEAAESPAEEEAEG